MRTSVLSPAASRLAGLALALLGLGAPAAAQTATRVLFVGNSFTHGQYAPALNYNAGAITDVTFGLPTGNPLAHDAGMSAAFGGVPGIFKKFTTQAGLNYDVTIAAVSGKSLEFHHANALSIIAQPNWDQVVLQEQSTRPTPTSRGGNRAAFYTYSTQLEQAIHGASPAARVYLYGTWARPDFTYPSGSRYAGLPLDSMAQDLHNSYYNALATNGRFAAVAPVGDAWMRAITAGIALRNPYVADPSKINLYASDQVHASKWGSYLSALVMFYQLTNVDPRTLGATELAAVDLGISATDAVALQQVAYQQVASTITATTPPAAPQVVVFPNPATNQLTVQLGGAAGAVRATLFNTLGQVVAEQHGTSNMLTFNTGTVANGMYLLRLQTAAGVSSRRVEVRH